MSDQWGGQPPLGSWQSPPSHGAAPGRGPTFHNDKTILASGGGWPPPTGPAVAPPGIAPTVIVTALVGVFGLIPAAMAATRAQELGHPVGKYWRAFGITLAIAFLVQVLLVFFIVLPAIQGTGLPRAQTVSTYDDAGPTPAQPTAPPTEQPPPEPLPPPGNPTYPPPATYQPAPPTYGGQPPARPPAQVPNLGTITSLPSGTWITVLESRSKAERSEAEAWAEARGFPSSANVVVVDSDRISGLNSGYWAVSIVGSTSRAEANGKCSLVGRSVGGTCYPRQVS
ncbi:MAG: hypothetical protein Q4F67_11285 [Propionibacteriaceae bacterium]|nr:hypothetical protein [Propionibacteriaceae bacterium]